MKIALYIQDGLEQIVLTPETDTETSILEKLSDDTRQMEIKRGSFYECRGGYVRYEPSWTSQAYGYSDRKTDESTMIVLRQRKEPVE